VFGKQPVAAVQGSAPRARTTAPAAPPPPSSAARSGGRLPAGRTSGTASREPATREGRAVADHRSPHADEAGPVPEFPLVLRGYDRAAVRAFALEQVREVDALRRELAAVRRRTRRCGRATRSPRAA
jgi:hypothetical protein